MKINTAITDDGGYPWFKGKNTLICDKCHLESMQPDEILIGGNWCGGWYHLQREIRGTYIDELRKPSNWDFCSEKCLQEFVQSLKID